MADPTVADIMRTDVPVASPEDSIATVARMIAVSGLAGVPVVEDGEIIGIITESDVIAREADVEIPTPVPFLDAIFTVDWGRDLEEDLRRVLAVTARELMSHPVINIKQNATLQQLATVMIDENVNPLPVLNERLELVGIVSRADLVRVIAKLETADATPAEPTV
ncbi:MAG: CBS domain-containing protein [Thermomicrobiales bacterium]|nr:CBS domain-containing protein [Thermomicrobiales bacterium]